MATPALESDGGTARLGDDISVVLLTYNHAATVSEAVRSALHQSVATHELIVSDDCSTDGTWAVLEALAAGDDRLRIVRTPRNLGMAGNANWAAAQVSRPYLALLHHDDIYREDLLSQWGAVLDRHPSVGFVFNNYAYHGSDRVDRHLGAEVTDGRTFLNERMLGYWDSPVRGTAMIRRSCWESVGGLREAFGMLADVDLWMRLAARWDVGYVDAPLLTVRQERPADYPVDYVAPFSWRRERLLYDIHAANVRETAPDDGRRWRTFRWQVSREVTKWLGYAVVRRRWAMLAEAPAGANAYELAPVRWMRRAAPFVARVATRVG